ncbi:MAG: Crp/Fnr family transcriptional regulator [Archangium sp.]|nr:Crp/Fnr family transcriptional regulator [Archangium sp.]MDP3152896.1 Crp/Fnr family transcriptional regulator [Archangium sp.]MDP3569055.1 Crp/Fnr family transcriptional regulator [Archangium sp.]
MSAEEALFQRFGKDIPKGTVLFREGDPGKEMYVLQSGKVAISKKVRDVEKVLAILGPGEFFGEMAIISNKPRNASATVEDEARVLVIDPRTFEAMIRGNSEIAVRMIKKLAERLSDADAQIENLLLSDPNSRIVHHMLQLCQSRGRQGEEGIEVDFPVRDLPRELAVGEPAIRFMVNRLERAGLVETSGDRLTVRDTARLFDFLRYLEMKWKFGEL